MSAEKFEQKLREKFAMASVPPSPKVWNQIDEVLVEKRKAKKRAIIFWWSGGIAASLLLALLFLLPATKTERGLEQTNTYVQSADSNPQAKPNVSPTHTPKPNPINGQTNHTHIANTVPAAPSQNPSAPNTQKPGIIPVPNPVQEIAESPATQAPDNSKVLQKGPSLREIAMGQLKLHLIGSDWLLPLARKGIQLYEPDQYILPPLEESYAQVSKPNWQIQGNFSQNIASRNIAPEISLRTAELLGEPAVDNGRQAFILGALAEADVREVSFSENVTASTTEEAILVEYPSQSSRFWIGGARFIRPRLSLNAGVGIAISNLGYVQTGQTVYALDSAGFNPSFSNWDYSPKTQYRQYQIELPLGLNFYLKTGKNSWGIGAGFSILQHISQEGSQGNEFNAYGSYTNIYDTSLRGSSEPITNTLAFTSRNIQSYLSGFYERRFADKWAFQAGPLVQLRLTDNYIGSLAQNQPKIYLGAQMGLLFQK